MCCPETCFVRPSITGCRADIIKKKALWQEVCNMMGEIMDVAMVKKRSKYLKDCYAKDKKKNNEYIPSGSAAPATRKNTFRFHEAMNFLSDCMETRQTVSTLPRNSSVPSSLMSPISPLSPIPFVSDLNVSRNRNTPPISPANAEECSTSASTSTLGSSFNFHSSKRRKSSIKDASNLDEAFIATLMTEPVTQNDPTHGFVLSLADGLRRLPYKEKIADRVSQQDNGSSEQIR